MVQVEGGVLAGFKKCILNATIRGEEGGGVGGGSWVCVKGSGGLVEESVEEKQKGQMRFRLSCEKVKCTCSGCS